MVPSPAAFKVMTTAEAIGFSLSSPAGQPEALVQEEEEELNVTADIAPVVAELPAPAVADKASAAEENVFCCTKGRKVF